MTNQEIQRRYLVNLKKRLIEQLGGKCQFCTETEKLQFAHKRNVKDDMTDIIFGEGRGKKKRLLHIQRYSNHYILLCKKCHKEYDIVHKVYK